MSLGVLLRFRPIGNENKGYVDERRSEVRNMDSDMKPALDALAVEKKRRPSTRPPGPHWRSRRAPFHLYVLRPPGRPLPLPSGSPTNRHRYADFPDSHPEQRPHAAPVVDDNITFTLEFDIRKKDILVEVRHMDSDMQAAPVGSWTASTTIIFDCTPSLV